MPTIQATPKELECLRLFKSRAIKLSNNSLIRDGYKSKVGLHLNSEEGLSFDIESLPAEESFRSLLLDFRHFWMKTEDCYFLRIINIVARYIPDARNFTDELKDLWNQKLFGSINIKFENTELSPNFLIDLWINGEYFHNDSLKKHELNRLQERIPHDFVKFLLIGAICECCNAILRLNMKILLAKWPSSQVGQASRTFSKAD